MAQIAVTKRDNVMVYLQKGCYSIVAVDVSRGHWPMFVKTAHSFITVHSHTLHILADVCIISDVIPLVFCLK